MIKRILIATLAFCGFAVSAMGAKGDKTTIDGITYEVYSVSNGIDIWEEVMAYVEKANEDLVVGAVKIKGEVEIEEEVYTVNRVGHWTGEDWFAPYMKSLEIPMGVTRVNIKGCERLKSVEIQEGAGSVSIESCSALESVKIAEGAGRVSIWSCSALESVEIPKGVESVNINNCGALGSVKIPEGVESVNINNCGALGSVKIPEGVESVNINNCGALGSVEIAEGVKSVHIDNCDALESVEIHDGVESIRLSKCPALESVDIPDGVLSVDISSCPALESVKIPEGVLKVALFDMPKIESVEIPEGVLSVNLSGMPKIESVVIPKGLKFVLLWNCDAIKRFVLPAMGEQHLYGDCVRQSSTIRGCVIYEGIGIGNDSLKVLVIEEGVTQLQGRSFTNLNLDSLYIPSTLTDVIRCTDSYGVVDNVFCGGSIRYAEIHSEKVFAGLFPNQRWNLYQAGARYEPAILGTIVLGKEVKKIEGNAFYHCTIGNIVIPDGVDIEEGAFGGDCTIEGLTAGASVYTKAPKPTDSLHVLGTVAGMFDLKKYGSIKSIEIDGDVRYLDCTDFTACENLKRFVVHGSVLSEIEPELMEFLCGLEEFSIGEGIEVRLGDEFKCPALSKIKIGEGTTSIPSNAFAEWPNLKRVVIPEGVTSVGDGAFAGGIEEIHIPASMSVVRAEMFGGWEGVKAIYSYGKGGNPFESLDGFTGVLYVPAGMKVLYDFSYGASKTFEVREFDPNATNGIEDVMSGGLNGELSEPFDVYSVSGVLVKKGIGYEELRKMKDGLYVIVSEKGSGKVIVR